MDAPGTRSTKSIRVRLEDEDGDISVSATNSRVFHAKDGPPQSKALRKINEPSRHGPHTRLNLQMGEL